MSVFTFKAVHRARSWTGHVLAASPARPFDGVVYRDGKMLPPPRVVIDLL